MSRVIRTVTLIALAACAVAVAMVYGLTRITPKPEPECLMRWDADMKFREACE